MTLHERCGKVTGSYRKTPGIAETWEEYSGRKLTRFFTVDSCQLSVLSAGLFDLGRIVFKYSIFFGTNKISQKTV
jgi:hypothetical protein